MVDLDSAKRAVAGAFSAALVAATLIAGPAGAIAAETGAGGSPVGTVSRGPKCAWTYFTDPRAVSVDGVTYLGCATGDGRQRVIALRKGTVISAATLMTRLAPDDHDNPSLLIRPSGKLSAFWSPHSGYGRPAQGSSRLYYRTTVKPLDASGLLPRFGRTKRIPTNTGGNRLGYTYSHPVRAGSRTWLFWRGGNWFPSYTSTTDTGRWSRARTLIRGRATKKNRPYVKYAPDGNDGILVAYSDGNPSTDVNDLRFARIANGSLKAADGRAIGTIGTPMPLLDGDLVHRHLPGENTWVMDVAADAHHDPVILYRSMRGLGEFDHEEFRLARWDGEHWVDHLVTPVAVSGAATRSPGVTLDHDDPSTVLLTRRAAPNQSAVAERWTTPDGGETWSHRTLSAPGSTDALRPITPVGLDGTGEVYWFDGPHRDWFHFDTSLRIWTEG